MFLCYHSKLGDCSVVEHGLHFGPGYMMYIYIACHIFIPEATVFTITTTIYINS